MTPALASLERYRDSALTRWLDATFEEWTGLVLLGGAVLAILVLNYLMIRHFMGGLDSSNLAGQGDKKGNE